MPDKNSELKKLEERIYLVCEKLHENEHIGDDCMCTTEIAPAYRFLLEAIIAHTNAEIARTLDRIEKSPKGANSGSEAHMMMNDAIQAERAKLKEVK